MDVYKVCPMAHVPRVYGECYRCREWFTLRKDRSVRAHICDDDMPHTTDRPRSLALICLNHRWRRFRPAAGNIQVFTLTEKGLQPA